jgi:hypothetical protein
VTVGKLIGGEFAEGLARFSADLAPLVAMIRAKDGESPELNPELITLLGQRAPESVIWLATHGSSLDEEEVRALPWDSLALLTLFVIYLNFVHNAALRVFTNGVDAAEQSVVAEHAAVASDGSKSGGSK